MRRIAQTGYSVRAETSRRKGFRRWRGLLEAFGCVNTVCGCISTEIDPISVDLACTANGNGSVPVTAAVSISVLDFPSYVNCSGVVVAPTLVLTAASCFFEGIGEFPETDRGTLCDGNWAPIERGDFDALIGRPYELDPVIVTGATDTSADVFARVLRTSSVTSLCGDDLAVLVLERRVDLPVASLRLDETTQIGESVTLSSLWELDGSIQSVERTYSIEEVTFGIPSSETPPRSLLVTGRICPFERGSPVFSSDTGALAGIVAWGKNECDAPDAASVVVRLAPFRRFLLETAEEFGETLRLEPNAATTEDLAPCPTTGGE